ncbi:ImmA/IrrE family metallo-endopeptidase [Lysinibacillus sp. KU-BSD001]|uniref:ImmA/IrrE family metallo-endopeptidase n=1 Tax=Lysinibacillus sp. KU-BSD001 TaxID=3141328 RepID=UPI0036E92CA7
MMGIIWSDEMVLGDYLISHKIDRFESYAKDILNKLNKKTFIGIDLYDLCHNFGILVKRELVPNGLNCAIPSSKGRRGVINLCIGESEREERVNLAHEFAHLYIHQRSQLNQNSTEIYIQEIEAFKLASNILVPSKELLKFPVSPDLNTTYIIADEISEHFNVTPEFAYQRLLYFQKNYKFGREEEEYVMYNMTMHDVSFNKSLQTKIKYIDLVILKHSDSNTVSLL